MNEILGIETLVFDDEITLWWKKESFTFADGYRLYLDGTLHGTTDTTHYTFSDLAAARTYTVRIEAERAGAPQGTAELTVTTAKKKRRLDVTAPPYLAVGDGVTDCTAAIQRALCDCTARDCVYLPAGTYLTGALDVHSHTELYLAEGATLQGSERAADYLPKIESRFEGTHMQCYRSLLNVGTVDRNGGYTCEDVVLRGHGTVFGGGRPLATDILETERAALATFLAENADYVKTCENANTIPGRARGRLIQVGNCRGVVIGGLTLGYGASWLLHFIYSRDIVTYNCRIISAPTYAEDGTLLREPVWNGDGWDPDSSENCVIFGTAFDTYDNSIAIKSGKNPEGNAIARPTRGVYVFDCRGLDVAIGTELSGGIEDVYVWDCELFGYGINIKTTRDRGAYIRGVHARDSLVTSVMVRTKVNYNNDGESAGCLTKISDLTFENLTVTGVYGGTVEKPRRMTPLNFDGFDEPEGALEGVRLKNVRVLASDLGEPLPNHFHNVKDLVIEP
ncbi:MAG: glycoside hydrolase family 28 protein [Clostridia bacterium]|nr:glycoside hydrolase family 28 protein [Clostridia bacterium]